MILYAESSAVIAWLVGESTAEFVREVLGQAEQVVSSDLTLIETDRLLVRAVTLGRISENAAAEHRARLNATVGGWLLQAISDEVVEVSRRPFPVEPIRPLDAIHLATALIARRAAPELVMLSLDDQIRKNARKLGLAVLPR